MVEQFNCQRYTKDPYSFILQDVELPPFFTIVPPVLQKKASKISSIRNVANSLEFFD